MSEKKLNPPWEPPTEEQSEEMNAKGNALLLPRQEILSDLREKAVGEEREMYDRLSRQQQNLVRECNVTIVKNADPERRTIENTLYGTMGEYSFTIRQVGARGGANAQHLEWSGSVSRVGDVGPSGRLWKAEVPKELCEAMWELFTPVAEFQNIYKKLDSWKDREEKQAIATDELRKKIAQADVVGYGDEFRDVIVGEEKMNVDAFTLQQQQEPLLRQESDERWAKEREAHLTSLLDGFQEYLDDAMKRDDSGE